MEGKNIYEPKFVEKLFDKMSGSYSKVNYITSIGFSSRWRKQCVDAVQIEKGKVIVDLMTGMGECWKFILQKADSTSKLIALDFSSGMMENAKNKKKQYPNHHIELLKENIFDNSIKSASADYVISGFGLKTFNQEQIHLLAKEIDRILKPNGKFSLIDVSVPKLGILKPLYMFYLKRIIPLLGKLFLGSPENYRMLGIYTEKYGNSKNVHRIFKEYNFEVNYVEYFFCCASGIKGVKK